MLLVILALLTATLIRYRRDVHSPPAQKSNPVTTTPSASPYNPALLEEADGANGDE